MPNTVLEVAAAVIYQNDTDRTTGQAKRQILLAKRPKNKHQGGKWEFPGGKLEPNETPDLALKRELTEELGIHAKELRPLIQIRHDYPERSVILYVYEVFAFEGKAEGKEGQAIRWVFVDELCDYHFPDANYPILTAVELGACCLITPEPKVSNTVFVEQLTEALRHTQDIRLVQFRAKQLKQSSPNAYLTLAEEVIECCHASNVKVILNMPPENLTQADGIHLNSASLHAYASLSHSLKPLDGQYLSAACHNVEELSLAQHYKADFVFLSPVKQTQSHPEAKPLGWDTFSNWINGINRPVFALGGMQLEDVSKARYYGAQGIAAIRDLWCD